MISQGAVELGPVTGDLAVHGLQPEQVAVRLPRGLVAVVRGLDDERLDRVVRDALGGEVAVGRVGDLAVELQEPGVVLLGRRDLGDRHRRFAVSAGRRLEGRRPRAGGVRRDGHLLLGVPVRRGEGERRAARHGQPRQRRSSERCPTGVLCPEPRPRARWDTSSPASGTASSRAFTRSTAVTPTRTTAPPTFQLSRTAYAVDVNPAPGSVNSVEVLVAHVRTHGMKSPLDPWRSSGRQARPAADRSDVHTSCRKPMPAMPDASAHPGVGGRSLRTPPSGCVKCRHEPGSSGEHLVASPRRPGRAVVRRP